MHFNGSKKRREFWMLGFVNPGTGELNILRRTQPSDRDAPRPILLQRSFEQIMVNDRHKVGLAAELFFRQQRTETVPG